MPNRFLIPLFALLACLPLLSNGQVNDLEPIVNVSFKTMAWDKYSKESIYFMSGNKEQKLLLRKMIRSKPYQYNGPATLVFYTKQRGRENQMMNVPVASVEFTPETQDPIVLFIKNPNPDDKRTYLTWLIDDNSEDFPYGSYQIFNLSKEQVRGRIDDQKYRLIKTGSSTIVTLSGESRNVMSVIQIIWEGQWETASSSIWTFQPNERNLVFVLSSDNPNYSFFDVKIVPEMERKTDLDVTVVSEGRLQQ